MTPFSPIRTFKNWLKRWRPARRPCDACDRPLVNRPAEDAVEGFFLCAPCRTVDVATALVIARARHRERLVAMAQRITRVENR